MPERGIDLLGMLDLATFIWSSECAIVAVTDADLAITEVNPAFRRLAGADPVGEQLGSFVAVGQIEAFRSWVADPAPGWRSRTWAALPGPDGTARDYRITTCPGPRDGRVFIGEPIAMEAIASALLDVNNALVEEHRRLDRVNERLDRVAQLDALTGVANRRAFDWRLPREAAIAANGGAFAVVMLDLDTFKAYNDRYGHLAGDAVLRWFGARLQAAARQGDLVARYGGEEFVAILPGADAANAARWADRLRQAMRSNPATDVGDTVTVSAGVAAWQSGETGTATVARADRALYAAKRAGRDRVVADGVAVPPPVAEDATDVSMPVWQASSIGFAIVDGLVVRRANEALGRSFGRAPEGRSVDALVHPDQRVAFNAFVQAAGRAWSRGTFSIDTDAAGGALLDHVTWARHRGGVTELLIEPASAEREAVDGALLGLLDEMVEVQRELEGRVAALARAQRATGAAERRAAHVEALLSQVSGRS